VRTLKTFQGTHILGASRGLLCDSYAVLFVLRFTAKRCIVEQKCQKGQIGTLMLGTRWYNF